MKAPLNLQKSIRNDFIPGPHTSESAGDVVARLDKLDSESRRRGCPGLRNCRWSHDKAQQVGEERPCRGRAPANPLPPRRAENNRRLWQGRTFPPRMKQPDPDNPGPLLRDYSVQDARDGIAAVLIVAMVRKEVAPGDLIPGAGRVLRIRETGRRLVRFDKPQSHYERSGCSLVARGWLASVRSSFAPATMAEADDIHLARASFEPGSFENPKPLLLVAF